MAAQLKDCCIVYKHPMPLLSFYIQMILRKFTTFEHLRLVEIKSFVTVSQWITLMIFPQFSSLCGYLKKYVLEINCSKFLLIQL